MTVADVAAVAAVGLGGSAGAVARYGVGRVVAGRRATAAVNVAGSFLLGVVSATSVGSRLALLLGVGFCGAFTTYSSFAVAVGGLLADDDHEAAVRFGAGTLLAAVAAVVLGRLLVITAAG